MRTQPLFLNKSIYDVFSSQVLLSPLMNYPLKHTRKGLVGSKETDWTDLRRECFGKLLAHQKIQ